MMSLFPGAVDEKGNYQVPELPYAYDALSEVIDEETMHLHHDKHHAGYVKGLIEAEQKLEKARESGDFDAVQAASRSAAFNGGGHFLHTMFWACMAPPDQTGEPSGPLADAIKRDFGGIDPMLAHFKAAAKKVEASGWGLLCFNLAATKLVILQAQNQHLLTNWASIPLMGVDVWEHAYYLKYKNDRAAYVDAFPKVINWKGISDRYALLTGHHA
jgi:Fe-Mn family superoxide dismutase